MILGFIFELLYWLVPTRITGKFPLVRIPKSNPSNLTHNKAFSLFWGQLRNLAKDQLLIAGPSMRWLREVYRTTFKSLSEKTLVIDNTDILILSASNDSFVKEESIMEFKTLICKDCKTIREDVDFQRYSLRATKGGGIGTQAQNNADVSVCTKISHSRRSDTGATRRHVIFRDSFHEIWAETSYIVDTLMTEVKAFMNIEGSYDIETMHGLR